jgi:GTP-binding protein
MPADAGRPAEPPPSRRPTRSDEADVADVADVPVVAVVGRPNVGKSTFVNRVLGRQMAIVQDEPGVTRDRKSFAAEWLGVPFTIVDTGGWLPGGNTLDAKVSRQVEQAVRDADVVVFLVDGAVGVTEEDEAVARWLRRIDQPVLLVVNKADNNQREDERWAFLQLGVGDPFPISALHGRRVGDLLDEVVALLRVRPPREHDAGEGTGLEGVGRNGVELDLDAEGDAEVDAAGEDGDVHDSGDGPRIPAVAIVGRPNVGKSTLFNRLTGDERSVVHDLPGTTRDAVDTVVQTRQGDVRFVDTAGMRRKSRIDDHTEYYSLVRALRAVDEADVAILVIDATEGVTGQDQRLAERVDASGCPIVVVLNKWDLIDDPDRRVELAAQVGRKLQFIGDAPVVKASAKTGRGVGKLLPVLADAIERYHRRVPTRDVNKVLAAAQQRHPAPHGARVLYALQGAAEPPTFTLFVNKELPQTYLRYLERSLREGFELGAVPVKLRVRRRGG